MGRLKQLVCALFLGTSLFGTAVHAVFGSRTLKAEEVRATLEQRGLQVASIEPVAPSLEDVFLDIVDRESTKGAA